MSSASSATSTAPAIISENRKSEMPVWRIAPSPPALMK